MLSWHSPSHFTCSENSKCACTLNQLHATIFFEKLIVALLDNKFPAFYGTRRVITVFTGTRHWTLSWARWIQSSPSHLISLTSILILSSQLHLCLSSDLFHLDFSTKNWYIFLICLACYMSSPYHGPWCNHPNNIWWSVQVMKFLIMQYSPSSRHFLLLGSRCPPQHPVLRGQKCCW